MRMIALPLTVAGAMLALATSAQAQASRTWVSGVGDDANPCSRTAPCKTFAGAISKTAANGEINCLDPAGYGAVTITKSMTIDCIYTQGSILNAGTNAVNIPFDNFGADVRRTVRLRGLSMNAAGATAGTTGVSITGAGGATSEVYVEDSVIDNNFSGNANGIRDARSGGGKLFVSNTTVRNNGAAGIVVIGSATRMDVSIDNVRSQNNSVGIGMNGNTKAMISRSVASGNSGVGIASEGTGAETSVDSSTSSNNATGIFTGSGGVIRVSNTNIAHNGTAATGAWISFGDNKLTGNTNAGTLPTGAGGASSNLGQQ